MVAKAAGAGVPQVSSQAGRSWAKSLMELPLSVGEEEVLVRWLAAQVDTGKPAGDLLPLYFLQVR